MDERTPTAVLGAAGIIGQHFARLLADHPHFAPPLLVGAPRSRGARFGDLWTLAEPVPSALADERVRSPGPAELARRGVRLVFSALPSGRAGVIETDLARRGLDVFTNASDHRGDPAVPLLVPEANPQHLELLRRRRTRGVVVANPNCTATGLTLALAPVVDLLAPASIHVATYQALSGAGSPGVPSLAITDNVIPLIPDEEEKVARESGRILGTVGPKGIRRWPGDIVAQCVRVGVRDGHLEAVTVVARRRPTLRALLRRWTEFDPLRERALPTAPAPPVLVRPESDRPQPLLDRWAGAPASARGMAVSVGRVRWDPPYLRFFVLSHNAVRGGAGGSVLNAELVRSWLAEGSPRWGPPR
ncbi:MAG: aspartate-semialdehyde dehydrogenase [Thermoplasmata archaeon]|nr:aspartate-semialdehyde dehydrogenase [Thermoplasmata archaeon]